MHSLENNRPTTSAKNYNQESKSTHPNRQLHDVNLQQDEKEVKFVTVNMQRHVPDAQQNYQPEYLCPRESVGPKCNETVTQQSCTTKLPEAQQNSQHKYSRGRETVGPDRNSRFPWFVKTLKKKI